MKISNRQRAGILCAVVTCAMGVIATAQKPAPQPLSPTALAVAPGGARMFVACATGRRVIEMDLRSRKVARETAVPGDVSGLALSPDGAKLYVTCAAPSSVVAEVDVASGRVLATIPAGHTAAGPALSPDGSLLYVCNRFNDDVSVIDAHTRKQLRRVRVEREPVSTAATHDGKLLLVANSLPTGRADAGVVTAAISVVDPHRGIVVKNLPLPNGSGQLKEIRISPDGNYAAVTHVLARFQAPTSQLDRGWMNTNALTLIDVAKLAVINTVLLDGPFRGAANPWGLAWSPDGTRLAVTHAGAHEVSVINFPALLRKLATAEAGVPDDLGFLSGVRQTVRLPGADRGPRAVAFANGTLFTADYFSDSLTAIDPVRGAPSAESIALGPKAASSLVREGEFYFHDAGICFQHWQSCSCCHPDGARADALNWDLLNDGIGNPKNTRSLLLAHRTPPTMSLGVRDTAETAVRSGIRYILFTQQPPEVAKALDAYLKSLKPVASPHLVNGQLSEAAQRGRVLFNDPAVGCASCHPAGLLTDLKSYDVGTTSDAERLDTPTLVEAWRTAPYLHDGSAATMREVLTTKNPKDKHGATSRLTAHQIDDLVAYVLSL